MFFYLSKILWFLIEPLNLILVGLLLACGLLWTRWWRRGRGLLTVISLIVVVIATVPLGTRVMVALENRFPLPVLPARIDGIIVLGGVVDPGLSEARGQVALNGSVERITVLPDLLRRYPDARVVFSGGSGDPFDQSLKEADYLAPLLSTLGVAPSRLILENQSRNTWENATHSHDLINPAPDDQWLLVTSAFHMPRAVGCFRQAGWNVLPYPVDYGYRGEEDVALGFNFGRGVSAWSQALHELLGLLFYRLTDRTSAIFPS